MYGRNGECPVAIIAPQSPADCFDMAFEAVRIATEFMVPTFLLSDGYIANGAEPWAIPDVNKLPKIHIQHPSEPNSTDGKHHENGSGEPGKFLPYKRNAMLVRPWAVPGTPGLEHRIGGIEKQDITGNVNYEPANHEHMVRIRAQKVANIAQTIPELRVDGDSEGELLGDRLGRDLWLNCHRGGTGPTEREEDRPCSFPLLESIPKEHCRCLQAIQEVPGARTQRRPTRAAFASQILIDAKGLNKVQGRPFLVWKSKRQLKRHCLELFVPFGVSEGDQTTE